MRIFAIRPEPGLAATIAAGRAAGLAIEGAALFEIRARSWDAPEPEGIDGLLVGSANAFRHAGGGLAAFAAKPVYAVGEATADAARTAGFPVAATGEGGLQKLLGTLAGRNMRLLRLAGAEHVPLIAPEGIALEARIVYESAALPMPGELAEELHEGGLVLLHSGAAARHFASECDRLSVPRGAVSLAALAPRVAESAGRGWAQVRCAENPREAALLALAGDMCK